MELKGIYYRLCTSQTKENKNENDNEIIKHNNEDDLSSSSDSESESEIKKETLEVPNQRRISKTASIKKENKASHSNLTSEKLKKKKKFRIKKLFRYEKKLLKIQKPNICWIIIGTISQAINGSLMPAIAILFSQIYSIFTLCDQDEQMRQSLQWMGVIMAIGIGALIVTILLNYSLSLAGSKLTTKLRILMFKSMLKQEISFHDLPENRSSVLSTQLSTSAPFCRGLTSDKVGLLAQGFSG
jgi:ATP-binding cassette, subfamily B (MDR/TAP), member 1